MSRRTLAIVALVLAPVGGALVAAGCSSEPTVVGTTSTIGTEGGSVNVDDLVLTIPAGALTRPTSITITRTSDVAPNGFVALTPIYRFSPDGLTFAQPARVSFAQPASAPNATIVWSAGTTFEALATQAVGGRLEAEVIHFSSGFVAIPPVVDGGIDAGTSDAGSDVSVMLDGSSCFAPPVIDPTGNVFAAGGTAFPVGSFGCSTGAKFTPVAVPFGVTKTQIVSFAVTHSLNFSIPGIQLRGGCDNGSTLIKSAGYDGHNYVATIAPGLYTLVSCEGAVNVDATLLTPPVPTGTNTSCNTAAPLPVNEAYPILDSNPRYYQFTANGGGARYLVVTNAVRSAGKFTAEVQQQCGNSSTDVLGPTVGTFSMSGAYAVFDTGLLPIGTYTVVLSNLDAGVQPKVKYSSSFP